MASSPPNLDATTFQLTDRVAAYMYARFCWYIQGCPAPMGAVPPLDFRADLVTDIEHLARKAAEAYNTPSKLRTFWLASVLNISVVVFIPWDVDRYAERLSKRSTGHNEKEEDKLSERFPPPPDLKGKVFDKPIILLDLHSRILAWYVPEALTKKRQVSHPPAYLSRSAG